ncbi:MAG: hypothetical protein U1F35_19035 [Steroidobacteraceae bacterium]
MREATKSKERAFWLIALLGLSALFMTGWFLFYPRMAALCSLAGVLACLITTVSPRRRRTWGVRQAERRDC